MKRFDMANNRKLDAAELTQAILALRNR